MIDYGLSFDCALSFGEIVARMNEIGPWQWEDRDSAWFGPIVKVRTKSLKLDLFESSVDEQGGRVEAGNGQQYCISVRKGRVTPTEHEWAAVQLTIRTELLPTLGAIEIRDTDPID